MMHKAGFFPSMPMQINFEFWFAPVDGRWRPFGISVGVGSASPVLRPGTKARRRRGPALPSRYQARSAREAKAPVA
jgi:hypothetical protein